MYLSLRNFKLHIFGSFKIREKNMDFYERKRKSAIFKHTFSFMFFNLVLAGMNLQIALVRKLELHFYRKEAYLLCWRINFRPN